jgi:hypothetical protein
MAITKADSQQADQIAQNLLATYQIIIVKDWGEWGAEAPTDDWQGGYWSLEELHTLQGAIADLARAMEGADKFTTNVGSLIISQEEMEHRGLASPGRIRFTASPVSIDKWTVVHELGHAWDDHFGGRLSKALQKHTGGYTNWLVKLFKKWFRQCDEDCRLPGCNSFGYFYGGVPPAGSDTNFNHREDFAEAVAAYCYPAVAQSRVERFKEDDRYRELLYYADYTQTERWAFVGGLIRGAITVR